MKKFLKIITFSIIITSVTAQDAYIISQQAKIQFSSVYQIWEDEDKILSEFSLPFYVYYPLSRTLSLTLSGTQANASGDDYADLSGFSDTQINMSYFLETYKVVLNGGINLPSGKKELTVEEFETSRVLSLNHFNFRTPNFGQGFSVNFGATWAYPLSKEIVVGLGGSYQLSGAYRPLSDMEFDYKPGDEFLATAGFDYAFSKTTTLSFDGIFTTYSADTYNGEDIYKAGNKIVLALQYKQYFDYKDIWLLFRYRSRSKSSLPVAGAFDEESEKTIPNNVEFGGHYRFQVLSDVKLVVLGNGGIYQKSAVNDGVSVYSAGFGADYQLNIKVTIFSNIKYLLGDYVESDEFSGFEFGAGVGYNF